MQMDAKMTWWLTFALVAIQGLNTVAWGTLSISPHVIAGISQGVGYLTLLLTFAIHGSLPGISSVQMPKAAIVALAIGLSALALGWAEPAAAQLKLVKPTGNPIADVKAAVTGTPMATVQSSIESMLAKPFQELAKFIGDDSETAIALATQIPELQDGHGQQCWMATKQFGDVIKVHPVPLTLKAQTDLQALRLLMMAANNLCANVHCTQVFGDLANGIQTLAPLNASIPIPSLHDICAKIPQIAVVPPASGTPAAPVTPPPTP